VAPNDGRHAKLITALASEIILRNGFEPMISLTVLTDRTLSCILSLGYDRDVAGEDDRAMACYLELLDRLALQGYYSYRLSVGGMRSMGEPGAYHKVLDALKRTLDPNDVVAPGRYVAAAQQAAHTAGR
jgi:4-cresol dehydrogenase (hydroxylating)